MRLRDFISLGSFAIFLAMVLGARTTNAALIFEHPNPQAGANFGAAIAEVGDVNGDGIPDLLVGAPLQDVDGRTDQGQSFVISGDDGTPLFTLDNPTPQAGAQFGSALARTGDIDGDGKLDFLVGAPGQDVGLCGKFVGTSGCSVGQAFVFSGSDGSLLLTLNHPTPGAGSFFGSAVASAGDLTGDSIPELIVGAPGQSIGVFVPSQAFVFNGKTGTPLLTLNDPNRPEIESLIGLTFGSVVASAGDLGGTETLDIIVGDAQQDVGGNTDQGQISVFSGDNGDLLLTLNHPAPQANALFGASAASIGDVNDDTVPDLIVGAPGQNVAGNPGQGQAYIFNGDNAELLFTLDNPTPLAYADFGFAVASVGDVNDDAIPDLIVGAPGQKVGENSGQGQAYVFSGADGSLLFTLDNPTPQAYADFGFAVVSGGDLDGDGIPDPVIGAPFQDVGPNPLQGQLSSPAADEALIPDGGTEPPVTEGPDLVGAFTKVERKTSSKGDSLSFTLSVTNTGNKATSEGFTVDFYLSEDSILDIFDKLVFSKTIKVKGTKGTIQPGNSINISKTLKESGQGKLLIAFVDSKTTITETNEENNITVEAPLGEASPAGEPLAEEPPPEEPTTTDICTTKIQAITLKYTGPDISGATVLITADKLKKTTVVFDAINLTSGTILSSPGENGFSIDATVHRQSELGSKTRIRINGVEEVLHTSCSTPFEAEKPAPLDKPKGDPSPNWFVVNFTQK